MSDATSGGCPVKTSTRVNTSAPANNNSGSSSTWSSWFSRSSSNKSNNIDPSSQTVTATTANQSQCPVQHSSSSNKNNLPNSIEEANHHPQIPHKNQKIPLSTVRTISSIPRDKPQNLPHHQKHTTSHSNWVYPSEQQFYNALQKKGWSLPPGMEHTIPHVVRIHNAVNEKGWMDVVEWERLRGNDSPRLVRFVGRPKDLSPKARLMSVLGGRVEPFDRHDWFVDDGVSGGLEERRYVIDFYNGEEKKLDDGGGGWKGMLSDMFDDTKTKPSATMTEQTSQTGAIRPPSMYLDVRPAIDDTDAIYERARMTMKETFPGIFEAFVGPGGSQTGVGTKAGNRNSSAASDTTTATGNSN